MDFDNKFLGFNILYRLGKGAFSTTYLGEQEDHRIAIKIIKIPNSTTSKNMTKQTLLGKDFQLNLRQTSTVLNNILQNLLESRERKGILRYYDYQMHLDKETGVYHLAILTEFLDSLNVHAYKNDLTVRNILKLGIDLCDGLEFLGRKGIFHGNIKESNIFFDPIKGFKLGDFFFNDALINTLTTDEDYMDYSCRFLAPEAYDDESLSHQTDIFTLGMLMYKLLNNSLLPYEKESENISHKEIRDRFLTDRIIPETLSIHPEIYQFLTKATAFHKGDRFLTFHQMKEQLQQLITNLPYNVLGRKLDFKPTIISNQSDLPSPKSNLIKEHPDLQETFDKEKENEQIHRDGTPFEIVIDQTKNPAKSYSVGQNERQFLKSNDDYIPDIEDKFVHSYFQEEEMEKIEKEGSPFNAFKMIIFILIVSIVACLFFLFSPSIIEFFKNLFN